MDYVFLMNGSPGDSIFRYLRYDPVKGVLYSRVTGLRKYVWRDRSGYLTLKIGRKSYLAHRVCWFLYYGVWPDGHLDHINGVKSDNRIVNLREATISQNAQNRPVRSRYLSKCIWFDGTAKKRKKRYCVRVQSNGVRKHIGWYGTEEEAMVAAKLAISLAHGEFGRCDVVSETEGEA
jgi:hypothetical protein